jgi:glucan 1,4-alpha-glucosidase
MSKLMAAVALAVALGAGLAGSGTADPSAAPGAPGASTTWTTGAKQGVGTSATSTSKVWYTLAEGVLTEVYYPTVEVANVRELQLVVSDGRSFTELERDATLQEIQLVDPRALVYRQVNTARSGKYRITKTYVTDPRRDAMLVDVAFEPLDGGSYRLYVLHDPSVGNSGMGDTARTEGGALVAEDGDVASALVSSPAFEQTSSGYLGASDGWEDVRNDHTMNWSYSSAPAGNVVQTGALPAGTRAFTLALGFGSDGFEATHTAAASLRHGFRPAQAQYRGGWHEYLDSLRRPALPRDLREQFHVAAMTLRAHEDKTYPGANIASLTIPWGDVVNADGGEVGGYHLVWSRDLYQVATALQAAGDVAGARRALTYLLDVQQKPDGSFPQNSRLDGTPHWTSLQLDEVAFPLILAWQLGMTDAATYRGHLKRAADFLVSRGPSTPQERWEEEGGYSPSTIAAEIAGLVCAAEIAEQNGDEASAWLYRGLADEWQRNVERWTFTTTGPLGDGRYYERIDGDGDPNDGDPLDLNNGGGTHDERSIVDGGFLELVRLGVKAPDDPHVAESLAELDQTIRVETPNGAMWYRYNHDGYGEKADGSGWEGIGIGRLWPLLGGERGEYEIANGRPAESFLRTLAAAANEGLMIPEQAWDRPEPTAHGFVFGEGTGSATPLAWPMAQFMRLAYSIEAGRLVEQPAVVAERYASGALPPPPALNVVEPEDGAVSPERETRVAGTTDGERVFVHAGGETREVPVVDGAFETTVTLAFGENGIAVVAVGSNGGTRSEQVDVVFLGRPLGTAPDPEGDDDGPGTYVYPAADAFNEGCFDIAGFGVYDDGANYNFVVTIAGDLRNPWGAKAISVQRLNVYVQTSPGGEEAPALPGTNANMAEPYQYVVIGDRFEEAVKDGAGEKVASSSVSAIPSTRQIAVSVPKETFGDADLAAARYQVAMLSSAEPGEGIGFARPVYDLAYWESTAGTDMWWIHDFRFGGGAGVFDGSLESRDTDTRDPNIVDVLVGPGQEQGEVLDWETRSPVALPYVELGPP